MTRVTNDCEHPARLRAGTGETLQENRTRFAFCRKKETVWRNTMSTLIKLPEPSQGEHSLGMT